MNKLPIEIMDRDMARILAEKTEAERLQIGWGMWRSARRMLTHLIRSENPEFSDEDVQREVARRLSHGSG